MSEMYTVHVGVDERGHRRWVAIGGITTDPKHAELFTLAEARERASEIGGEINLATDQGEPLEDFGD